MQRAKVLIVDDDVSYAERLAGALNGLFVVEICHTEAEFRKRFAFKRFDLLIVDMRLRSDREGLALLREAMAVDPFQAAIVMTAYADMETYTDALEAGAMTYLDKAEFSPALIARTVEAIVEQARMRRRVSDLEEQMEEHEPFEIIGASAAIRRVREELRRAAEADFPVFLIGGTGVGKELVARNIHRLNRCRASGPFLRFDGGKGGGGDLTLQLLGAADVSEKSGRSLLKSRIEAAKGGVIFIDGVDGLDEMTWAAVLSLINSGSCKHPVDGRRIASDTQIIVAERPECERIQQRRPTSSRAVTITLPALREHAEDVALLAQYSLHRLFREGRTRVRALRAEALAALERLSWPGNVRELQSAIAYAAVRADAAGEKDIGSEHLPLDASDMTEPSMVASRGDDYQTHLARAELTLVESAIMSLGPTTKNELAKRLGYNDRFVFARRIRKCLTTFPALKSQYRMTAELAEGEKGRSRQKVSARTRSSGHENGFVG